MIPKFTTVYAGRVDLPDRGQNTARLCSWADTRSDRGGFVPQWLGRSRRADGRALHGHGSPAHGQLVDRLKGFEEGYSGMQHISFSSPIGMLEGVVLRQFQWLAEEVMPAFRTDRH